MTDRRLRTYRLTDLGCKINQYETQLIAEKLEAAGLLPAADGQSADLCLVNTCAVTGTAAAKSARAVRQLKKRNPGALVVVAGCAVSAAGKNQVLARTGADLALAQAEKLDLPGLPLDPVARAVDGISRFDCHQRAFIKIQDGCGAFCSYCIVPYLRGSSRSRTLENIRREAASLAGNGHRELVISGVHLGLYGRDLRDAPSLSRAAQVVLEAAPACRVRLSSLDPTELGDDLLELIAAEPRLCPHLHLPLQSGDDGVLARMRRHYNSSDFLEVIARTRARLDDPGISSDVMVGFPGESDAAFENTMAICREAHFSRLHVFPYSPREGTPAATMPEQVPSPVAKERAARLIALGEELAGEFARSLVGRSETVLAEEHLDDGRIAGYSARYLRTAFRHKNAHLGELYEVKLLEAEGPELVAELRTAP
jgi:threonylcarbamoyladenosine tRNA methylthiotransferase MtaB